MSVHRADDATPILPAGPSVSPELSQVAVANVLLRHRRLIVLLPFTLCVLTVAMFLTRDRQYTSEASFMPQTGDAGDSQLASVAAQFGFALPTQRPGESPAFYADLLVSDAILSAAVDEPYTFQQGSRSRQGTLATFFETEGDSPAVVRDRTIRDLRGRVDVEPSRETDVVRFSVSAPWPELAQAIATRLIELLNRFNLETRQSQAGEQRRFVQGRMEDAREQLGREEDRLRAFLQGNRQFSASPELQLEYDRLQRAVAMRQEVFTSLAQAFEKARIDEVRNVPVITVIDRPDVPVRPDGRGTVKFGLLAGVIGLALAVCLAFCLDLVRRGTVVGADEFREFETLRTAALAELRRPWLLLRRGV